VAYGGSGIIRRVVFVGGNGIIIEWLLLVIGVQYVKVTVWR
jgi:hypothetical protein